MKEQALPSHPRFPAEAVLIPFEDELLIDGTHQTQAFQGESVGVLSRLLPLLSGRHTVEELELLSGEAPRGRISPAVRLLLEHGLVEDGLGDEAQPEDNEETLAFFHRFSGATGWNASGVTAYRRMQASDVAIIAGCDFASEADVLKSVLSAAGLNNIRRCESIFAIGDAPDAPHLVVSVCSAERECEINAELDRQRMERGFSWLRFSFGERDGHVEFGPLFDSRSPCYRCFRRTQNDDRRRTRPAEVRKMSRASRQFWIGMIATEVLYFLSRIGPRIGGGGFRRYNVDDWGASDLCTVRMPDCAACASPASLEAAGSQTRFPAAYFFEDSIGRARRDLTDPAGERRRQRLGAMLGSKPIVFPVLRKYSAGDAGTPGSSLCSRGLMSVLAFTAGIRRQDSKGTFRRWNATAGNLGSVEIYVIVRSISGLPAGLYVYQPLDASLGRIQWRNGQVAPEELIGRISPDLPADSLPEAIVISVGAFHRLAQKYGAFAWRLVHMDAGVAMSQFQMAAGHLQLCSGNIPIWSHDLIEELLHLAPEAQFITGVAALSSTALPAQPARRIVTESDPPGAQGLSTLKGLSNMDLVRILNRESRAPVWEAVADPAQDYDDSDHDYNHESGDLASPIPLPASQVRRCNVEEVFRSRCSVRSYLADPVSLPEVSGILSRAAATDVDDWPHAQAAGQRLTFAVLAIRVNGLKAGFYLYQAAGHDLHLYAPLPPDCSDLFLQPEFSEAAAVFWIIGNLARVCAHSGTWGYRQLLTRAGSAANRLWFEARTFGLAGTIVAGLAQDAVRTHLGLDGFAKTAMVAVSVGHSAADRDAESIAERSIELP